MIFSTPARPISDWVFSSGTISFSPATRLASRAVGATVCCGGGTGGGGAGAGSTAAGPAGAVEGGAVLGSDAAAVVGVDGAGASDADDCVPLDFDVDGLVTLLISATLDGDR